MLVRLGRKGEAPVELNSSDDLIAIRTRSGKSLQRQPSPVSQPMLPDISDATLVVAYPEAGVEVFRVPLGAGKPNMAERKTALRAVGDVRFAGGVLTDSASGQPVLYTENLFIKFIDGADEETCRAVLRGAGLTVKQEVEYAANAFFVKASEGTGQQVFAIAEALLDRNDVEYCHPELIRQRARKGIFSPQWHLRKTVVNGFTIDAHANVEEAHEFTRGEGVTIAVIDDGVDVDHPEFLQAGKVVAPYDATEDSEDPRPRFDDDNHGTACAGVAAAEGVLGASGVAPAARLMPIRLASGLGSQREADAFVWAARNGADVISCSWGPQDGKWWDPTDPSHRQVTKLPANTRLAIEYAVNEGRGGKGCVVLFAAGNGNESVDNDGYASNPNVVAVAASNDRGRRSVYSDFGKAVWCAFPSNDFGHPDQHHPSPLTPGIWTVDRRGRQGYNPGSTRNDESHGDAGGMFSNSFGGTSSACPGAAGVVALMLSINPSLRWSAVKDLLKHSCDKIDPEGGDYATSGHSPKYGWGRLNARTAVALALPEPRNETTILRRVDMPFRELQGTQLALEVPDHQLVDLLTVGLELQQNKVGRLIIKLQPPSSLGLPAFEITVGKVGGSGRWRRVYDDVSLPALGELKGKSCKGIWRLTIQDPATDDPATVDSGSVLSWSLRLHFAHTNQPSPTSERRLEARSHQRSGRSSRKSSPKGHGNQEDRLHGS